MAKIIKVIDKRGVGSTYYLKKKYHLKESVKGAICLLVFGALIFTILMLQAARVETLENTNDTETEVVQVQINR